MIKRIFLFCLTALVLTSCEGLQQKLNEVRAKNAEEKNGQVVKQDTDPSQVKDGVVTKHYNNGQLKLTIPYKNGKKNGLSKQFYKDGAKWMEIEYVEGKKHGSSKLYYETGILYRETLHQNGLRHGIQKVYWPSGKLLANVPWNMDQPGVGLEEFKESGNPYEHSFRLIVEERDLSKQDGNVYLTAYVKNYGSDVTYYVGELNNGFLHSGLDEKVAKDNKLELSFPVPKGQSLKTTVPIVAVFKTIHQHALILTKQHQISVSNP